MQQKLFPILFFTLTLLIGCSSLNESNEVNIGAINTNSQKTFKIGTVRVESNTSPQFYSILDKKEEALKTIPIDNICKILESRYGIIIDKTVDKKIFLIAKPDGFNYKRDIFNPYYGNTKYIRPSFAARMLGIRSYDTQGEPGDVINIIYGVKLPPLPFGDIVYWYSITVKSEDETLISLSENISEGPLPKENLNPNYYTICKELIAKANNIDKNLAKNIKKTGD